MPADSYNVVVFENRFPSLRGASTIPGTGGPPHPPDPPDPPDLDDGLSPQRPSGMAVWINDIVPETAARRLREA